MARKTLSLTLASVGTAGISVSATVVAPGWPTSQSPPTTDVKRKQPVRSLPPTPICGAGATQPSSVDVIVPPNKKPPPHIYNQSMQRAPARSTGSSEPMVHCFFSLASLVYMPDDLQIRNTLKIAIICSQRAFHQ